MELCLLRLLGSPLPATFSLCPFINYKSESPLSETVIQIVCSYLGLLGSLFPNSKTLATHQTGVHISWVDGKRCWCSSSFYASWVRRLHYANRHSCHEVDSDRGATHIRGQSRDTEWEDKHELQADGMSCTCQPSWNECKDVFDGV